MTSTQDQDFDYAIVGGGAAGTILAIRLLQDAPKDARIALIEAGEPGRGVAYGSDNPAHVLNVPAGGMSMFAERPNDFVDFLINRDGGADPAAFMPRRDYAAYLAQRLSEARTASQAQFLHLRSHVLRVMPQGDDDGVALTLTLADGSQHRAKRVALTPGNRPRKTPFDNDGDPRVLSAWDHAGLEQLRRDDQVVVVGSGLSMVDVVLGLQARGHQGGITVVSRHGLLPLPHAAKKQAVDVDIASFAAQGLRQRVRTLRTIARRLDAQDQPWQSLMDALRHHVRVLWQSLSDVDQRRFLRHVVRYWDVHRHRIPREVAARLRSLQESGALQVIPGRVKAAMGRQDHLSIEVVRRLIGSEILQADWLVNATGIETRALHFPNPMLQQLLEDGHARPGPHGLGIDTNEAGDVIDASGATSARLAAIGSLRLGNLWETTAVPDLREDAARLAKRWLFQA